jgi:hypothetical protein
MVAVLRLGNSYVQPNIYTYLPLRSDHDFDRDRRICSRRKGEASAIARREIARFGH